MESKTQWSPWALQVPPICKQLEPRLNKVVIEDYNNNEWKCELDEPNTIIVKFFSKV